MLNPEIIISICESKLNFDGKRDTIPNFRKFIRKNNKEHIPTQIAYLYVNSIMNNNTIIAEPVDKVILKKETKPKDDKLKNENDKLKKEINKLKKEKDKYKKQNEMLIEDKKQYDEDWNKRDIEHQKERDKSRNEIYDLENDIKQLKYIIEKYKTQIQNIKDAGLTKVLTTDDDIRIPPNKPKIITYKDVINNGISILDGDYTDDDEEYDDELSDDPDDELNEGLN